MRIIFREPADFVQIKQCTLLAKHMESTRNINYAYSYGRLGSLYQLLFPDTPITEHGSIGIRVGFTINANVVFYMSHKNYVSWVRDLGDGFVEIGYEGSRWGLVGTVARLIPDDFPLAECTPIYNTRRMGSAKWYENLNDKADENLLED